MKNTKKEIAAIATIVGLLISSFLVSFSYELGDFEDEYRPPNTYQPNKVFSIAILSFFVPLSQTAIALFLTMVYFEDRTLQILLALCTLVLIVAAVFSMSDLI